MLYTRLIYNLCFMYVELGCVFLLHSFLIIHIYIDIYLFYKIDFYIL